MSRDWKNGNNSHFGLSDRTIYGIVAIPAGFVVGNMTLNQLILIAFVGISIDCPSIFLEIVFCTPKLLIFFDIAPNQVFQISKIFLEFFFLENLPARPSQSKDNQRSVSDKNNAGTMRKIIILRFSSLSLHRKAMIRRLGHSTSMNTIKNA